ncbi:DeoR/GlpR family DNA-binding transcription regulator [Photobacterium sp. TLY01]|uniref:DeoR/GlpR family DNA-binding transcription regulator n=1 Tax=Photobacterium sp. TLY01 TaxID=2907534 RepID=UPI001F34EEE7|nr:DeoR/GlpR family DNA-binding transcription regulator [Photobacterium sp. TLY01]UIP30253.1 DeoR/GlpR family DNA-binding transcription regulator [Photobacterium sp. TLY01]
MIPAERQRAILALLGNQQVISINELTQHLDVSHMTIRRDIAKLEADGRVMSVSGGVQLSESIHIELPHDDKIAQQRDEKARIGQHAASYIKPHSTIYLDAGTTTLEIAHQLNQRDDLTVITNDFAIAAYLMAHSDCMLYHTGGKVDRHNQSCVGDKAVSLLREMNVDMAFISSSSWNQRGISTPSEDKVTVKRAIVAAAKTNYLVTDASKYGKVATFHALDISSFDKVITDQALSDSSLHDFAEKGIEIDRV